MLKSIEIKNFKSIKDLRMDLSEFSVIVGNNGVGKSNFLKAISLVSLLASGKQLKDSFNKLLLNPTELFFDESDPNIIFAFELEFKNRVVKYQIVISRSLTIDGRYDYKILSEKLSNGRTILSRDGDKIEFDSQEEGAALSNVEIVSDQLAISILKKPTIVSSVQRFLAQIKVDVFEPSRLKSTGSNVNALVGIERNLVENLFNFRQTGNKSFNNIENESKEHIKGLERLDIKESGSNIILTFKENGLAKELSSLSSSDGNIRSIGIISEVYGDPKPTILFIDELENSLHPKRIKSLVKLLDYLSNKEDDEIQIVIVTHSPIVLKYVNEKNIRYMFKHNGETILSQPYKTSKIHEYLKRAEDEELDLGDLFEEGVLEEMYKPN